MRLRSSGLLARAIGDEIMVLDLEGSRYVTVHGSGVLLYELLDSEREQDELVRAMVEAYDVDEATAKSDVEAFLRHLGDEGLLEGLAAAQS